MQSLLASAYRLFANPRIRIGSDEEEGQVNIPTVAADEATIAGILNTVYLWSGIVAVLVIVIAGLLYVVSNGNPENIKRAKNALLYGVIGLVVIMLAFTMTQLVIYFVT